VIEKGSARRLSFDTAGSSRQQLGTDLVFKIPICRLNEVVMCAVFALLPPSGFPRRQPRRSSEDVVFHSNPHA